MGHVSDIRGEQVYCLHDTLTDVVVRAVLLRLIHVGMGILATS